MEKEPSLIWEGSFFMIVTTLIYLSELPRRRIHIIQELIFDVLILEFAIKKGRARTAVGVPHSTRRNTHVRGINNHRHIVGL